MMYVYDPKSFRQRQKALSRQYDKQFGNNTMLIAVVAVIMLLVIATAFGLVVMTK